MSWKMRFIFCGRIKIIPLLLDEKGLALEQCAIITLIDGQEMAIFDSNLELDNSFNNKKGKIDISISFPTIKKQKDKIKNIVPYPNTNLCYSKKNFTIPFSKNKFFGLITKVKLEYGKLFLDEFELDVGKYGQVNVDLSGDKVKSSLYRVGDYVQVTGRTDLVEFIILKSNHKSDKGLIKNNPGRVKVIFKYSLTLTFIGLVLSSIPFLFYSYFDGGRWTLMKTILIMISYYSFYIFFLGGLVVLLLISLYWLIRKLLKK